jgi:hypothetical protein
MLGLPPARFNSRRASGGNLHTTGSSVGQMFHEAGYAELGERVDRRASASGSQLQLAPRRSPSKRTVVPVSGDVTDGDEGGGGGGGGHRDSPDAAVRRQWSNASNASQLQQQQQERDHDRSWREEGAPQQQQSQYRGTPTGRGGRLERGPSNRSVRSGGYDRDGPVVRSGSTGSTRNLTTASTGMSGQGDRPYYERVNTAASNGSTGSGGGGREYGGRSSAGEYYGATGRQQRQRSPSPPAAAAAGQSQIGLGSKQSSLRQVVPLHEPSSPNMQTSSPMAAGGASSAGVMVSRRGSATSQAMLAAQARRCVVALVASFYTLYL